MTWRETVTKQVGQPVRVLTGGTNPFIGWVTGSLIAVEDDHLVVEHDGATVLVPFSSVQWIRYKAKEEEDGDR